MAREQRLEQIKGWLTECLQAMPVLCDEYKVVKPKPGLPGEIEVLAQFPDHIEVWRMKDYDRFGNHTGWYLKETAPVPRIGQKV